MPGAFTLFFILLAVWAAAAVLLWWGRLPGRWRRGLALAASGAGLVFLVMGLSTVGERETLTTSVFLLGPRYVTGKASASASIPYYVLTAISLLLGTAGLAVPDLVARRLSRHWMATAILLSLLVTVVRFALERAAAPPLWTWVAGVTALAPVVGAYFALNLREEGRGKTALARSLLVYGLTVRAWIAILYVVATTWQVGSTHYNLSALVRVKDPVSGALRTYEAGSLSHLLNLVIFPQLLLWPLYTLVAGMVGAAVAIAAASLRGGPHASPARPPVEMAPAGQDS